MQAQTQKLINKIEDAKSKLIKMEVRLIETEKPTKDDIEAVRAGLRDYYTKKTVRFKP